MTREEAIELAIKLKSKGMSALEISQDLNDRGYRTKTGAMVDHKDIWFMINRNRPKKEGKRAYKRKPKMLTLEVPQVRKDVVALIGTPEVVISTLRLLGETHA